jgi:hypothetical protein
MEQDCIKECKIAVQEAFSLENDLDPSFCILRHLLGRIQERICKVLNQLGIVMKLASGPNQ